ncbi:MAG TPA: sigma-70 family RNA polymerase sigma factor [Bryobacteraceae bacterium]|nr:sigma-70 family RNA polymerase sigma factor [Bryobacteraceae bacterium]
MDPEGGFAPGNRHPDVSGSSATTPAARGDAAVSQGEEAASETELVHAVLRKDRKATEEFVSRYSDSVYSYLSSRLLPHADVADDCFQQVFLDAWQALPGYRGDSGLKSWLLGIARHKVQDHFRERLRLAQWSEEDAEPAAEESLEASIEREEEQSLVWKMLGTLPENDRILLVWRYWERQSAEEMARQTGKSVKGVERALARAREHFRRRWQSEVQNG